MVEINKDLMFFLRDVGCELNDFLYEGKMSDSIKKSHTNEEFEEKFEDLRKEIWNQYQELGEHLGWF